MRMCLLLCVLEICFPLLASAPDGAVAFNYTIPGPPSLDMQRIVKCTAVSSVVLRESESIKDLGRGTLLLVFLPDHSQTQTLVNASRTPISRADHVIPIAKDFPERLTEAPTHSHFVTGG